MTVMSRDNKENKAFVVRRQGISYAEGDVTIPCSRTFEIFMRTAEFKFEIETRPGPVGV